ncbi:hypothetical protein K469DRAFT_688948 [Zopfia rhizophila CBS 207.26]|uniref:Uncharacterized protein n=1 Tax=Zopfia rhizophila CBS 207.26 TaxID=1314779 RepID=A0A6A6E0I9_9PEZI|nr:hypothetical protein K469DRAFT_688948 [Zopfia rhizophila CBS 207.26]
MSPCPSKAELQPSLTAALPPCHSTSFSITHSRPHSPSPSLSPSQTPSLPFRPPSYQSLGSPVEYPSRASSHPSLPKHLSADLETIKRDIADIKDILFVSNTGRANTEELKRDISETKHSLSNFGHMSADISILKTAISETKTIVSESQTFMYYELCPDIKTLTANVLDAKAKIERIGEILSDRIEVKLAFLEGMIARESAPFTTSNFQAATETNSSASQSNSSKANSYHPGTNILGELDEEVDPDESVSRCWGHR